MSIQKDEKASSLFAADDWSVTYDVVKRCLAAKEAELVDLKNLPDAIREEFEGSLSYKIGKLLCLNFR